MTGEPLVEIDFIRCDGAGYCASVAPELFDRDDWGYPILRDPGDTDEEQLRALAARAVSLCPRRALALRAGQTPRVSRT